MSSVTAAPIGLRGMISMLPLLVTYGTGLTPKMLLASNDAHPAQASSSRFTWFGARAKVREFHGYRPYAETITPFAREQQLVVVSLIRRCDRRNAAAAAGDDDDDRDRDDRGRRR